MRQTSEEKFWTSRFGKEYINRNPSSIGEMDNLYIKNFGVSRSYLDKKFLNKLKIENVLEVGCNIGTQLAFLQKQKFKNLHGLEIFGPAVEYAKKHQQNINIVRGSVFDIPFKDKYFDLVFTSGLLIHINPRDIKKAMREIYRTSKKYIWGCEFSNPEYVVIDYWGNKNRLWKGDFCQMYLDLFPNLRTVKRLELKYLDNNNYDEMFLLKKSG